jgi:hypothetical protein
MNDKRLEGVTFSLYREQSEQHLDQLNTRRRHAAAETFVGDPSKK